jgi:hypothetical protein
VSCLGSIAVITRQRLDATVDTADVVMQAIWDEWGTKGPVEQASEALHADRALLERVASRLGTAGPERPSL